MRASPHRPSHNNEILVGTRVSYFLFSVHFDQRVAMMRSLKATLFLEGERDTADKRHNVASVLRLLAAI